METINLEVEDRLPRAGIDASYDGRRFPICELEVLAWLEIFGRGPADPLDPEWVIGRGITVGITGLR